MIVFGHPGRSLTEDYRDRIHTFEFMACVDIEVFGIYRPPKMSYSASGQELGLKLLNDPILSDLRIVTTDNQSMDVNSVVLAQRWPSIKHLLSPLINPSSCSAQEIADNQNIKRELKFPDTHQVLVAFLQFIYTDHLLTAQQNQPHILARLLLIANLFEIPRLKELATHTLHQMLNMSTAPMIYESASLSNAVSLQIRALRVMIKARKMRQMHPPERSFTSPTPPSVVRTLPSSLSASPRPVEVLSRQQSELNHFSSSDYNMRRISQSTPSLSISHSRSSSQRSLSTDSDTSSPNMNNIKPTKMANFFNRPSPIYEQPPVKNSPSKSTGMFWTKKKANDYFSRPTRSETTKMGSFNFLSSH
jgi:hypothetical protein